MLAQSLAPMLEQETGVPVLCLLYTSLAQPGAKVLMKSGRQLPGVLAALERRGLLERSALVDVYKRQGPRTSAKRRRGRRPSFFPG